MPNTPENNNGLNGNVQTEGDNPLDTENVIKHGIAGMNLHDFLKLSGMYEQNKNLPFAN